MCPAFLFFMQIFTHFHLTRYVKICILYLTNGGKVKRKDILKKLAEAGFTFKEGDKHTKAYDKSGAYRTAVGRHTEIDEWTVKKIEKQSGVKMK